MSKNLDELLQEAPTLTFEPVLENESEEVKQDSKASCFFS